MAVFDSEVKTKRRVQDPITDDTLPPIGGLKWPRIASDSALSGTIGVDCKEVHGNRWQQVEGDLTESYTGNKKIDVKGKHTETIMGDRSLTVTAGNLSRTVSAGKVTDKIAMNHDEEVGAMYSLQAVKQDFQGNPYTLPTISTSPNA